MSEFKNKRLHLSIIDGVFIVVFICLSIISAYFWSEYTETKDLYNIEKTNVDFIITAPSKEQVSEIEDQSHIDKVVPYVYKTITIDSKNKAISANLYIIENTDDLEYTVFSDELLISEGNKNDGNIAYISDELAKKTKLGVNDSFTCKFKGKTIELTVSGIYKDDHRSIDGTIITFMQGDIKTACGENYNYNGAYICCNDTDATRTYLKSYEPQGDLRSRNEFDSEELYQSYLNEHKQTDYSKSMFDKQGFVKELKNRNDSKLFRQLIISFVFLAAALLVLSINITVKPRYYIKHNVNKDLKNNFTDKQEKKMFGAFFRITFAAYVFAMIIIAIIGKIVFKNDIYGLLVIIELAAIVLLFVIIGINTIRRLKKLFFEKA